MLGLVASFRKFLSRAAKHHQVIWMMVQRDFKARYVGSVGGILWSILNPLLLVAIYSLVFSLVFGRTIGETPFALWLFCALLPWLTFMEILRSSVGIIEKYKNLITKTPFPSELLPVVIIGAALTNHLVGLGVLVALLLVFQPSLGWAVITLPFYLLCLSSLALGLSWIISSVNVFIRDVGQVVNLVLQLWFYLCPIIYPASIIPESYRYLLRLNPFIFITEGYRRALLTNEGILLVDFLYYLFFALTALFIGGWIFRRLKGHFAEYL